jgi:general nucleoside transport system ATP-binding protein
VALADVDFAVRSGEVHALLGENGAGKSTLMNLLSGLLRPSAGAIYLGGEPVQLRSPAEAALRGVGIVHQHFLLVPTLTVAENLLLGAPGSAGGALRWPLAQVRSEAEALATRLGWELPWDSLTGGLPLGTQQRIEILKALRGDTKIVLFDEPTAVLTPTETPELFEVIRRLADEGRGVVFISHKLDEVLALSDRITVLRRGRVVARFDARGEADEAALASAMVGEDSEAARMLARLDAPTTPRYRGQGENLVVRTLAVHAHGRAELAEVDFTVAAGEIFGIAGVDGNGQDVLAECLTGLRKPTQGEVTIGGVTPPASPAAFQTAGVTSVPADRQKRGLALPLTLTENLTLGVQNDPRFRRGPLLNWRRLRERAGDALTRFDIRAEGTEALARSLSGGNQQKVVLARALADSPKVVVAVNPTRGLDVGAIAFVHDALRKARASGTAIVLISTELDEIQALSDTIGVLYEGRLTIASDWSRATLGSLMGGGAQ